MANITSVVLAQHMKTFHYNVRRLLRINLGTIQTAREKEACGGEGMRETGDVQSV